MEFKEIGDQAWDWQKPMNKKSTATGI